MMFYLEMSSISVSLQSWIFFVHGDNKELPDVLSQNRMIQQILN